MGYPCIFVRLYGCNLNCSYCDTSYAKKNFREMSIEEIVRICGQYQIRLVEITGGEPLLQSETPALAWSLISRDYTVLVETNGSLDIGTLGPGIRRIIDIKCPSSNESHNNRWENLGLLRDGDEIKFVIQNRADYEYALKVVEEYDLLAMGIPIHLSPVMDVLGPPLVAEWILKDRLPLRLHLQLHKIIWPEGEPKFRAWKG